MVCQGIKGTRDAHGEKNFFSGMSFSLKCLKDPGSSPIVVRHASLAQLVEHRSRKAGVTSSSLVAGSRKSTGQTQFLRLTCFYF